MDVLGTIIEHQNLKLLTVLLQSRIIIIWLLYTPKINIRCQTWLVFEMWLLSNMAVVRCNFKFCCEMQRSQDFFHSVSAHEKTHREWAKWPYVWAMEIATRCLSIAAAPFQRRTCAPTSPVINRSKLFYKNRYKFDDFFWGVGSGVKRCSQIMKQIGDHTFRSKSHWRIFVVKRPRKELTWTQWFFSVRQRVAGNGQRNTMKTKLTGRKGMGKWADVVTMRSTLLKGFHP